MKAGAVRGNRRGSLDAIPEERMPDRLAQQKLSVSPNPRLKKGARRKSIADFPVRNPSWFQGQPKRVQGAAAESPRSGAHSQARSGASADEPANGVVVVVRFRPLNLVEERWLTEKQEQPPFVLYDGKLIEDRRKDIVYSRFDTVLDAGVDQEGTYDVSARPLVQHVLEGYNAGLLAYGQSGGGKTYSMLGDEGNINGELRGVIPRAITALFEAAERKEGDATVELCMSFYEIYKDDVYDLLRYDSDGKCIKLPGRENRHMLTLSDVPVETQERANEVLQTGQQKRRYRSMPLNPVSSRSHGVIVLKVKRRYPDLSIAESALYFVDLMGSEPLVADGDSDETTQANMDLLTLGKVISSLADKNEKMRPPYRDSTLTWVLRDVLGGNYMATMLVTCSPHLKQYSATSNTIEFADQCIGVQRKLSIAERQKEAKQMVEQLRGLPTMANVKTIGMTPEASGMSINQLRTQLMAHGLDIAGVKDKLLHRFHAFTQQISHKIKSPGSYLADMAGSAAAKVNALWPEGWPRKASELGSSAMPSRRQSANHPHVTWPLPSAPAGRNPLGALPGQPYKPAASMGGNIFLSMDPRDYRQECLMKYNPRPLPTPPSRRVTPSQPPRPPSESQIPVLPQIVQPVPPAAPRARDFLSMKPSDYIDPNTWGVKECRQVGSSRTFHPFASPSRASRAAQHNM